MDAALTRVSLAAGLRRRATLRNFRLATGLVLFAYVLVHLVNHALVNVSLEAGEAALGWVRWFWRMPVPTALLYGSLLCHLGLGLWSLYERPRFAWTPSEAAQLALGLAIPPLLVGHVAATRLAYALFGTSQGYAQHLYFFRVVSPADGALQALALLVAWSHGCLGLFFWLRLKPWFGRAAPVLLAAAVLVPTAALFGFLGGGRAVAALAADENWRIENVPVGTATLAGAAQIARLNEVRSRILAGLLGLVGAALGGRVLRRLGERRRGLVRLTYPDGRIVSVPSGTSVLEASRRSGIRHASVCGGRGRCSTCRVRVAGGVRLPAASRDEQAVLDRVGAGPGVRLACQLKPAGDLRVYPLVAVHAAGAVRRDGGASGEERFIVAVFVDMRGSTRLAERRLPFDTVFLINRFLDAVVRAVVAAGGSPNQFLGDGLLALFGLTTDARTAARQALRAVAGVGAEIAALNALMAADLPETIRFGIGVHAGTAILGEIGSRESGHAVFTAIGDPVNVAARLQAMTKARGCEALVSEVVFETAGVEPDLPRHELAMEGRDGQLWVRPVARANTGWGETRRTET